MTKKEIPFNRILIIDDSPIDYFIADRILKRHKPTLTLYQAMSVDLALDLLKKFKPNEVPDLILLDLHFNRQSKQGIDFIKEYNNMNLHNPIFTKIVILTAYSEFKDMQTFLNQYTLTEVLEKPFSMEKLMAC